MALLGAVLALAAPSVRAQGTSPAAPTLSPAVVAASYRIHPGDLVAISVLRVKDLETEATVSPDGILYLKDLGPVKAAGATVAELENALRERLSKRLRNPRVTVTLLRVVPARVTVLGEVTKPGPIDLEEGLRARKALELAGGVTKEGDLRRVILIRKDQSRVILNIGTDERAADPTQNPVLQEEDSLYVAAVSKITVIGEVGKPGPVEMEEGLRVRKALDLAGGVTKNADLGQITVIHRDLTRTQVNLRDPEQVTSEKHNLLLAEGDSIEVLPLPRITISGAVTRPGPVDLEDGLRVRKAIDLAGGPLKDGDLTKVTVVHMDLSREIVNLSGEDSALDAKNNLVLQPGDSINVPLPFQVGAVTIRGEGIQNPGSYDLKAGWGLDDLIVAAGKLTLIANTESIQLIRNGAVVETVNLIERLKQGLEGKVVLKPGDEVFIPKHESVVLLVGPVPNPGPRALRKGQRISDFLRDGDPQTTMALDPSKIDMGKAELFRKGQPSRRVSLKRVLGNPERPENVVLESGDLLFLPPREPKQKPGMVDWLRSVPYIGMFANLL